MAENYITKQQEKGTVNISEDVIASMVTSAVLEVEGITGFGNTTTPELVDLMGKKNSHKGLKIRVADEILTIDVLVIVRLGGSITDIAEHVQDNVCREMESITGMKAVVNVHVTGVSFDKDK